MRVRDFARVLQALAPRSSDFVIVGGWAWYLYRKHLTGERSFPGEFTRDVDVAVPRRLASVETKLDELLAGADFEAKMSGEERPPVTRYFWPSADNPEAAVEFLTPALGSGGQATLDVDGIVAQQLRFVDLLLRDPLVLEMTEGLGDDRFSGSVRVPRVGLFVWQKALTLPRRHDMAKRDKDLFYIFDLVDQSRGLLSRIEEDIRGLPGRGTRGWKQQAMRNLIAECGELGSSGIGKVLNQIPPESRPQRRYVHETFLSLIDVLEQNKV